MDQTIIEQVQKMSDRELLRAMFVRVRNQRKQYTTFELFSGMMARDLEWLKILEREIINRMGSRYV